MLLCCRVVADADCVFSVGMKGMRLHLPNKLRRFSKDKLILNYEFNAK